MKRAVIVAWGLLTFGVAMVVAALPVSLAVDRVVDDFVNPLWFVFAFVGLLWLATGAFVVSRQPSNWAGWIFCFIGWSICFTSLAQAYAVYGLLVEPGSLPWIGVAAWFNEYSVLSVAFLPLLFLLFPDGRVPSPGWRWAVAGSLGGVGLAFLAYVVRPETFNSLRSYGIEYENPFGIDALGAGPGSAIAVGTVIAMVSSVACVLGLRIRYRRSAGEERQQMRWLVFVASVAAVLFTVTFSLMIGAPLIGLDDADGSAPIFPIFLALTGATVAFGVPAAFLVAVFRYRLYDLDVVIRKTVVGGAMAVFIAVVYAAIVGGVGAVLGSRGGPTLSFLAAAVLAIAFQPVRERARRFADRVAYGKRATPYEVLTEFSGQVGETYASDDVLTRMAAVLGEGTGAETATVWLRLGDGFRADATWPSGATPPETPPDDAVEVRHHGDVLGALSVRMPSNDPMDPSRQALIRDLAAQAGLVLRNVRLIEELRASRQRLVAAQDEERRKLERNIHDGVQQQLVALQVRQRLAGQLIERDPAKAVALVGELQGLTQETLEDLRDLARGIYPPLLADQGLVAALDAQARKAVTPTTVRAGAIERYRPEVEATVYFCCLESMNNIAKYARASRATIDLSATDGVVIFEVTDDGDGFDPTSRGLGTGLQGIVDRVEALGGSAVISSSPGEGTTVHGEVPVGSGA